VANAGHYTRTSANIIGAEVIYVDVDKQSRNLTAESLLPHLKNGIDFVVATHLYGLAISDIVEIAQLCIEYGAVLIEDCAQAHGAEVNGVKVGSFGKIACYSFYPTKNLGALGDGGAITTSDSAAGERARNLRTYGWSEKYIISIPHGRNSRLDALQAGYLNLFLKYLDDDNLTRRKIASIFNLAASNTSLETPYFSGADFVSHLYVLTVPNRTHAINYFNSKGIATAVHYPIADFDQPYLGNQRGLVQLPVTKELSDHVLTLPCFPEMKDFEVESVSVAIQQYAS
jgi:dTDP-3-amino-2,3,6-trideoxy-4-keto-D-glucose/dTDP-3-amino-3,4,6-trideoxy-alpha-D-glucose/dTDP-2,6-dideoxy-D-kanosamine transaminase